jgi:hypothetical protein
VKYMLLIAIDPSLAPTDPAELEASTNEYGAFTQRIIESGELVSGERLHGNDVATSVRIRGGKVTTTDGPFVETTEFLGGFYVVDVKDLDRALELAAQLPAAGHGVIEVRPVWEM